MIPIVLVVYFAVYPPQWLRDRGWQGEWRPRGDDRGVDAGEPAESPKQ
jgi:hypothetical protein